MPEISIHEVIIPHTCFPITPRPIETKEMLLQIAKLNIGRPTLTKRTLLKPPRYLRADLGMWKLNCPELLGAFLALWREAPRPRSTAGDCVAWLADDGCVDAWLEGGAGASAND